MPELFKTFEIIVKDVIERCGRQVDGIEGVTRSSFTIQVPGGDDKYPSFWIRDAVMQAQSGLLAISDMQDMLLVALSYQNGPEERKLLKGMRIPPWAIADHINLAPLSTSRDLPLGACFFPGTYQTGQEQGYGFLGLRPADDSVYELIELAWLIVQRLDAAEAKALLRRPVHEMPIWSRLVAGFRAMVVHPESKLPWNCQEDWAAISFHDAQRSMGETGLASVLRYRAATRLAELAELAGQNPAEFNETATIIQQSVLSRLLRPDGWLMTATQINRQPCLWSTALALEVGLLPNEPARRATEALIAACRQDDQLEVNGYLRHVPKWGDYRQGQWVFEDREPREDQDHSAMDRMNPWGHYQSGGYWPQPLGWVVKAIAALDRSYAMDLANAFMAHTVDHRDEGAPFEWINPDLAIREGKWYGPSAALPYWTFRELGLQQ